MIQTNQNITNASSKDNLIIEDVLQELKEEYEPNHSNRARKNYLEESKPVSNDLGAKDTGPIDSSLLGL